MEKENLFSKILIIILFSLIACSITITYKVMVIDKSYEIFTNPDGPDTSDYLEEE